MFDLIMPASIVYAGAQSLTQRKREKRKHKEIMAHIEKCTALAMEIVGDDNIVPLPDRKGDLIFTPMQDLGMAMLVTTVEAMSFTRTFGNKHKDEEEEYMDKCKLKGAWVSQRSRALQYAKLWEDADLPPPPGFFEWWVGLLGGA